MCGDHLTHRAELITHLRDAARTEPQAAKTASENTPPQAEQLSLIDQLVDTTQQTASRIMKRVQTLKDTINSGPERHFNPAGFFSAVGYFLLSVAVTFAFFHLIARLQALFLSAFAVIEFFKAVLRVIPHGFIF